jgi:hypothetical protein
MNTEQTDERLTKAIADYRDANARCAYYGLRALLLHIRKVSPEATTAVLEWSDQGDYLTVTGALDVNGQWIADDDTDWDEQSWASNLGGNNEATWVPLASVTLGTYYFDVERTLTATAEEYAP